MTKSTRGEAIRRWVEQEIDARFERDGVVRLPEVADEAVRYVTSLPQVEAEEVLWDIVRPFAYESGQAYMTATRERFREDMGEVLVVGDGSTLVSRSNIAKRAAGRFARWREYDGEHYVSFTDMRKAQLLKAAKQRFKRGDIELHTARFEVLVASGMDEGETVKEAYTEGQLEAIWEQAREEIDDRLDGLLKEEEE
jgi:hypothetical protein